MKVVFPLHLKAFCPSFFSDLTYFTYVNFDMEVVLPSLFGLVVTEGRAFKKGRIVDEESGADLSEVDSLVQELLATNQFVGFTQANERTILKNWLLGEVAETSGKGRSKGEEQIYYLKPLHLAMYGAGLPKEQSRKRGVDVGLYLAMFDYLSDSSEGESSAARLKQIFIGSLGKQADFSSPAENFRPKFDLSDNKFDLNTTLALRVVECFMNIQPKSEGLKEPMLAMGQENVQQTTGPKARKQFLLPNVMKKLGSELLRFIVVGQDSLPSATSRSVAGIANLGLFRYMLLSAAVCQQITQHPASDNLPQPNELEIYVDFTDGKSAASEGLSQKCAQRDIRKMVQYFYDVHFIKICYELSKYSGGADWSSDERTLVAKARDLISKANTGDFDAVAGAHCIAIRDENLRPDASSNSSLLSEADFNQIVGEETRPIFRLHRLALAHDMASKLRARYIEFFKAAGGLKKSPGGILHGGEGAIRVHNKNLCYRMNDELLSVLVNLAFIEVEDDNIRLENRSGLVKSSISLKGFLQFLNNEYGILVYQGPSWADPALRDQACDDNLKAIKRRLQAMGYLTEMTDEFNAQRLRNPRYLSL